MSNQEINLRVLFWSILITVVFPSTAAGIAAGSFLSGLLFLLGLIFVVLSTSVLLVFSLKTKILFFLYTVLALTCFFFAGLPVGWQPIWLWMIALLPGFVYYFFSIYYDEVKVRPALKVLVIVLAFVVMLIPPAGQYWIASSDSTAVPVEVSVDKQDSVLEPEQAAAEVIKPSLESFVPFAEQSFLIKVTYIVFVIILIYVFMSLCWIWFGPEVKYWPLVMLLLVGLVTYLGFPSSYQNLEPYILLPYISIGYLLAFSHIIWGSSGWGLILLGAVISLLYLPVHRHFITLKSLYFLPREPGQISQEQYIRKYNLELLMPFLLFIGIHSCLALVSIASTPLPFYFIPDLASPDIWPPAMHWSNYLLAGFLALFKYAYVLLSFRLQLGKDIKKSYKMMIFYLVAGLLLALFIPAGIILLLFGDLFVQLVFLGLSLVSRPHNLKQKKQVKHPSSETREIMMNMIEMLAKERVSKVNKPQVLTPDDHGSPAPAPNPLVSKPPSDEGEKPGQWAEDHTDLETSSDGREEPGQTVKEHTVLETPSEGGEKPGETAEDHTVLETPSDGWEEPGQAAEDHTVLETPSDGHEKPGQPYIDKTEPAQHPVEEPEPSSPDDVSDSSLPAGLIVETGKPMVDAVLLDRNHFMVLEKKGGLMEVVKGSKDRSYNLQLSSPLGIEAVHDNRLMVIDKKKFIFMALQDNNISVAEEYEPGHAVSCFTLNPYKTMLAYGSKGKGEICGLFLAGQKKQVYVSNMSEPGALAFSFDGRYLAAGLQSGEMIVLDIALNRIIQTLKPQLFEASSIDKICFGPGDCWITAYSSKVLARWEADGSISSYANLTGVVTALDVEPESGKVAFGSRSGYLRIKSADLKEELFKDKVANGVVRKLIWEDKGNLLVVSSNELRRIKI